MFSLRVDELTPDPNIDSPYTKCGKKHNPPLTAGHKNNTEDRFERFMT